MVGIIKEYWLSQKYAPMRVALSRYMSKEPIICFALATSLFSTYLIQERLSLAPPAEDCHN
jgi:hypothetical protein